MLKQLKVKPVTIILTLPLALLVTNAVFTRFIQDNLPFLSRRNLGFAAVAFIMLFVLIYATITIFEVQARWYISIEPSRRWKALASAALLSLWLVALVNTNKTCNLYKNPFLHPLQTISIDVPGEKNPSASGYTVELVKFDNQFGYTSFSQFETEGIWTRTEANTLLLESPDKRGRIRWQGRTGDFALIGFAEGPDRGIVRVVINGIGVETVDLYAANPGTRSLTYDFAPAFFDRVVTVLFEFSLILLALYLLLLYAGTRTWLTATSKPCPWAWLLYALPMIACWGLCLLVLWPGIIGSDSLVHFRQAWYGGMNDWHAVLYTLLIGGLTRITPSPALIAAFQILCLALTVAWGLRFFDQVGVPCWVPWAISVLIALSIPITFNVITLWKDIPYSTAVLVVTLMLLFTVYSRGSWLEGKWNIAALGMVSALIILLRQNGLLVPLATFILLWLRYRSRWKSVLTSFAIMVGVYLLFTGPVYRLLKVNTDTYKVNAIIIHHLGAHINAGTTLQPEESEFLYRVMPASQWAQYDCTLHNILWYPKDIIDRDYYNRNSAYGMRILIRLFLANPTVDINHMLCASSMVWSPVPKAYFMESAFLLPSGKWVVKNELGIMQQSIYPKLAQWLYTWHTNIDQGNLLMYILIWRPAVQLFAAIACALVLAFRRRQWRYLMILTPLLVHSITLMLVNVAQDLRYQLPAYLIAPIFLGFLLIPKLGKNKGDEATQ